MASPAVATTNSSATSSAGTTHTVNLPTGITSGDLLLIFIVQPIAGGDSFSATGWTQLYHNSFANTAIGVGGCLYRAADGTEGATISVTSTASAKAAHISYRITGADASAVPNFASSNSGSAGTSTPDPPALTPAGGSKDYLWIATNERDNTPTTTAYPTNYSLGQVDSLSGGSGAAGTKCGIGVAARQLTASSEDPSAFTLSGTPGGNGMHTLAISPAAAAAATSDVILPFARRPFMRTLLTR